MKANPPSSGNVRWPAGAVGGAPVPPGAPKVFVRLTLHPRASLRLPAVPQLGQGRQGAARLRQGLHGAAALPGGLPDHLPTRRRIQQQPAQEELAQRQTRPRARSPPRLPGRPRAGPAGPGDGGGRRWWGGRRQVRRVRPPGGEQTWELWDGSAEIPVHGLLMRPAAPSVLQRLTVIVVKKDSKYKKKIAKGWFLFQELQHCQLFWDTDATYCLQ